MKCGKIIGVGNTATVYEWEEVLQMNVTREMIQYYLSVIITVRKGECPNE